MSQLAQTRPLPRSTTHRTPAASGDLRLVAPPRAGHGALMAFCLALLVGAFLAVLLVNISMAKGSFLLGDLQRQSNELTDTGATLQRTLDAESTPAEIARRALALGMVPSAGAAFLRLSDGTVIGVAQPAPPTTPFTVVAQGPQQQTSAAAAQNEQPASPSAPGSSAAVDTPQPGTTVTHEGAVTRTTTVVIRDTLVETTVTTVNSDTGMTTSTTTTSQMPAQADPGAAPQTP